MINIYMSPLVPHAPHPHLYTKSLVFEIWGYRAPRALLALCFVYGKRNVLVQKIISPVRWSLLPRVKNDKSSSEVDPAT